MPFRKSTKPKEPPRGNDVYDIAVRALASRARSTSEIRTLLIRRGANEEDIGSAISRLREHGYLDDERFAKAFVRSRIDNQGHGAGRVRRDLAKKRVSREIADKALASGYEPVNERDLLRDYLRRKLRLGSPPTKASALASLFQRLLRAGFSSATIVKELAGLNSGYRRNTDKPSIDPEKWREWIESLANSSAELSGDGEDGSAGTSE
jgi:regulatory protein